MLWKRVRVARSGGLRIRTVGHNAMVSRVPTRVNFGLLDLFGLARASRHVAVNLGLPSNRVKHGSLVGVRGAFLDRSRISRLTLCTPRTAIGHVSGCRIINGSHPDLPRHVSGILIYPGDGYVDRTRPISSDFTIQGHTGSVTLGYGCYRGRFSRGIILTGWLQLMVGI